jgi:hypothetical protein
LNPTYGPNRVKHARPTNWTQKRKERKEKKREGEMLTSNVKHETVKATRLMDMERKAE